MPTPMKCAALSFIAVAVVLVFFVCWTPFHAQRLMFVIVTLNNNWTASIGSAHHVLYLASGECRPILYPIVTPSM